MPQAQISFQCPAGLHTQTIEVIVQVQEDRKQWNNPELHFGKT